jgi:hypothetical protein
VEQADVPVAAHVVEEAHQRAGTLREFEAIEQFILCRGPPAHHVPYVPLRHLVVGEVERLQAMAAQVGDDARGLVPPLHLDADEDMRLP